MGKRVGTAKWMEKQNRWQIKVQKDGERRTFTSSKPGRTGQREANAKADAWLDDGIENANKRVSALLDEFIADLKARTSRSNWHGEEGRVKKWIKPQIGKFKMSQLTDQKLQNVINNAYQTANLSKKSLKNLRATLFAFCKYCRKNKISSFTPEDVVLPSNAISKEKRIIQPEDLKTFFTVDTTIFKGKRIFEPYIYAFRFQIVTGLRPGEIIGLNRSGDIIGDIVSIKRAVNIYGEETAGKNQNSRRSFLLFPLAKTILNQQLEYDSSEGSLFKITSEQNYRQHLKRYCESNNIPYITPYELRHTFVSIAKNLPESSLKQLVGHSAAMDTYGVYAHQIAGEEKQTAENLESIFSDLLAEK